MSKNYFLHQIDDLFTEKECQELIAYAESQKWEFCDAGGIAHYYRVLRIDKELADKLFVKIKPYLPETFKGMRPIKLNDHFRYSKYNPGGLFTIHRDGINVDADGNRAIITLNIFLNIPEEGGGTTFFERGKKQQLQKYVTIKPKPGRGALFYNQLYHQGDKVISGYKYLLRTDVMANI